MPNAVAVMSLLSILLTAFLLVLIVAGALWAYSAFEQKRQEELEALAARRGWSMTVTRQSLGRPSILRLTPRSGQSWQVEVRHSSTRSLQSGRGTTLFHAPATKWEGDILVIGPPQTPEGMDMSETIMRQFDNQIARTLIRNVVGPSGAADYPDLTAWDAPEGIALFASADPAKRTDIKDFTSIFVAADGERHSGADEATALVDGEGLRVGKGHSIRNAAKLEAFVDFAISLNRHLSRP